MYNYFDVQSGLNFYQDSRGVVSHNLFVKYVPFTTSPLLTRRFEVSAGIGTSFNKCRHNSFIYYKNNWQYLAEDYTAIKKIGLIIMSDFDYFLTRELSLFLSINKSLSKPFKPNNLSAVHPLTNENILYETIEVYPFTLDILIGLRIHLMKR